MLNAITPADAARLQRIMPYVTEDETHAALGRIVAPAGTTAAGLRWIGIEPAQAARLWEEMVWLRQHFAAVSSRPSTSCCPGWLPSRTHGRPLWALP